MIKVEVTGADILTKYVKTGSGAGVIYVPKKHIGHKVIVIIDGDIQD